MCFFRCIAILASSCLCLEPSWQAHVFCKSHFMAISCTNICFAAAICGRTLPSPRVAKNTLCQAGSNGQLCDHEECHDQGAQEGHEECHDQGAQEGHEDQAAREDHQEACHCHEGHEGEAQEGHDQPCAPPEGPLHQVQEVQCLAASHRLAARLCQMWTAMGGFVPPGCQECEVPAIKAFGTKGQECHQCMNPEAWVAMMARFAKGKKKVCQFVGLG